MTPILVELSEQQTAAFVKELEKSIQTLDKRITQMLAKLEIKNGVIIKSDPNFRYVASLLPQLQEALEDAGYADVISNIQAGDAELLKTLRKTSPVKLLFTRTDINTLTALRNMQNSEFLGIGAQAMEAVRQTVMNTIMTGAQLSDGLGLVRAKLNTNLKSYAWTYANTARRDVIQQANDLAAANIEGEKYWAYNGPLDDVTRPACQELLKIGVFTDAERDQWEAEYAGDRMYNCRHSFDLISKTTYEENKK